MHSPRPSPLRWTRRAAVVLALALTLGFSAVAPSSAAPAQRAADRVEAISTRTSTALWSTWRQLWSPLAAWLGSETTGDGADTTGSDPAGGSGSDGGTSGSGGLDPGGGGGYVDPNG